MDYSSILLVSTSSFIIGIFSTLFHHHILGYLLSAVCILQIKLLTNSFLVSSETLLEVNKLLVLKNISLVSANLIFMTVVHLPPKVMEVVTSGILQLV